MNRSIVICMVLAVCGLVLAQTSGPPSAPAVQTSGPPAVRIAIVDSNKAFMESTEGKKFLSVADKISKKKRDEEVARIRSEMVLIVQAIAKEKDYGLVLDLGTSGIVTYRAPVEDLTKELVDRYNSPKR